MPAKNKDEHPSKTAQSCELGAGRRTSHERDLYGDEPLGVVDRKDDPILYELAGKTTPQKETPEP